MKDALIFLQEHALRARSIGAPQASNLQANSAGLPQTIRDAARRGWRIFPVLTGSLRAPAASALITTATSDLSLLEKFSSQYPDCHYGLATGPDSGVWVAELDGQRGAAILYELAGIAPQCVDELWDGQTLLSCGGTRTYAFFEWPEGMSMRRSGRHPQPGLVLHGDGSWVPLPPSEFSGVSHSYLNDAAVAATPNFLVELLFKPPDPNSGAVAPPKFPPQPIYSRSFSGLRGSSVFDTERKGFQMHGPVAWRSKFSVCRRR